jgi:hypothetical protein
MRSADKPRIGGAAGHASISGNQEKHQMTLTNFTRIAGAGTGLALVELMGVLLSSPRGTAQDGSGDIARIQEGFLIAPVVLNLKGMNAAQIGLVGLGSYLVNGANDCNFCHSSGGPPNFNFLAGHNPYFLAQGPKQQPDYLPGWRHGLWSSHPF